jgi:hypothetical protein
MVVDKALFLANRTAMALFNHASRKCGVYKQGPERELCISKIKLDALMKQLQIRKTILASCPKQKNPEKCNIKVKEQIAKILRNIDIQKNNVTIYQKEVMQTKEEKAKKEEIRANIQV